MTGNSIPQILYTAKFPTEQACKEEAAKQTGTSSWYPVQKATCTFDMTKGK